MEHIGGGHSDGHRGRVGRDRDGLDGVLAGDIGDGVDIGGGSALDVDGDGSGDGNRRDEVRHGLESFLGGCGHLGDGEGQALSEELEGSADLAVVESLDATEGVGECRTVRADDMAKTLELNGRDGQEVAEDIPLDVLSARGSGEGAAVGHVLRGSVLRKKTLEVHAEVNVRTLAERLDVIKDSLEIGVMLAKGEENSELSHAVRGRVSKSLVKRLSSIGSDMHLQREILAVDRVITSILVGITPVEIELSNIIGGLEVATTNAKLQVRVDSNDKVASSVSNSQRLRRDRTETGELQIS
jgi:hypothetical protein